MGRGDLTNEQWERLEPLLPPHKPKVGRAAEDHRRIINGILWIDRTGAPWRDLPERYGPWRTVASRFYRWQKAGIWDGILKALQQDSDREDELDWETHYVDSTTVRAHQHAAGAKGGPENEALGYGRGGFSTKIHLRAEGGGKPMVFVLTAGQRNEMVAFEALMERGAIERERGGRPKVRPRRLCGDKGYSNGQIRRYLRKLGLRVTIPRKSNEHRGGPFARAIYRTRNRIERLINRLKQFRRVATRYEKRAENYRAMLTIAAIKVWL
jgi:transposase